VKFCQAFRIDSFDKHRLYNVEKEWINSDRSGEEIKDFELLKKKLEKHGKRKKVHSLIF
jgi:hypothetical protein